MLIPLNAFLSISRAIGEDERLYNSKFFFPQIARRKIVLVILRNIQQNPFNEKNGQAFRAYSVQFLHWTIVLRMVRNGEVNLMIIHGGAKTIIEAVSNGIPSIVIPHLHDQFRNADMIEERRIGKSLRLKLCFRNGQLSKNTHFFNFGNLKS